MLSRQLKRLQHKNGHSHEFRVDLLVKIVLYDQLKVKELKKGNSSHQWYKVPCEHAWGLHSSDVHPSGIPSVHEASWERVQDRFHHASRSEPKTWWRNPIHSLRENERTIRSFIYNGIPISRTLDLSNPPITRTKSRFRPVGRTLWFYPRFVKLSDFSSEFSFRFEVWKIGLPLHLLNWHSVTKR